MKVVNNIQEFTQIIGKPGLTVVDFTASWCGPCARIAPFYEELSKKYPEVVFIKVDVDEAQEIAQAQGVRSMPTFKFFSAGKELETMSGADPAKLEALVVKYKDLAAAAAPKPFAGQGHTMGSQSQGQASTTAVDPKAARLARFGGGGASGSGASAAAPAAAAAKSTAGAGASASAKASSAADDDDEEVAMAIAMSMEPASASASTSTSAVKANANAKAKGTSGVDADGSAPDAEELAARKREKEEDPDELVPLPVDAALLAELLSMGFSDVRARKGLHYGSSVEGAINWLSEHENDANIDDEFLVRKSDVNKVPLTPEEVAAKMEDLKKLAAKRKKDREEREAKEAIVREKERRERGQNIAQTQEERARLARGREQEKIKKEKAAEKNEKARLLAEIAKDKELRAKNKGVLPSKLGVDGYAPSAVQYDTKDDGGSKASPAPTGATTAAAAATVLTSVASSSLSAPAVAAPKPQARPAATTAAASSAKAVDNPEEAVDSNIQTIARYRMRGDGGNALKLLLLFVKNVAENPAEVKYRSINTESNAFKTKLGSLVGPVALLRALGFEKNDEGKMLLTVPDSDTTSFLPIFQSTVRKLQAAEAKFAADNPN